MTKGTVPEGASCTHWKGPLENDSRIRKAVKAVSGIILTDTSGNPAGVGYTSTTQNSWNSLANQGSDYVELIRSSYGGEYILSNPSCSLQVATGINGDKVVVNGEVLCYQLKICLVWDVL